MISNAIREQIREDLAHNIPVARIHRLRGISRLTIMAIRDGKSKESPRFVCVSQFRCPECGTLNYYKQHIGDRICFMCSVELTKNILHARK